MSGRAQKFFDNVIKGLTGGEEKKKNESGLSQGFIFPFFLQYFHVNIPAES